MNGHFGQFGSLGMRAELDALAPLTEDRLRGLTLDLPPLGASASTRFHDPRANRWVKGRANGGTVRLPPFRRSLVARLEGGKVQ